LDRLTLLHDIAHRDRTRGLIGADQIPDKEVTALEPIPMFVNDNPEVERSMRAAPVFAAQRFKDRLQAFQSRHAAQLMDEIVFRLGDDVPVADRATALRDDWTDVHRPGQSHPDQSIFIDLVLQDETVFARIVAAPS
jgi:hypothetical protein